MDAVANPYVATVLLVEDDLLSQTFARSVLEEADYRVVTASDGHQGIAAFRDCAPDCVLLDMRMPGLDGRETCLRLRALPAGRDVPIVFMTAQGGVDSFDDAFACGADDFVTKPVSPGELCERVRAAIGLRRARADAPLYELLKAQRDRLARQHLMKQRLSALLVHDLKAPLNTISVLAQGLLRGKELQSAEREALSEIRSQTVRLAGMVMDLLDISKSSEGELVVHRAAINVFAMYADVLADFEAVAASRGVTLQTLVFAEVVDADPSLLRRVLSNLLDNALRYAPRGTTVTLSASPRPPGIQFSVVDEGEGIPRELREKVFDAFARADDHLDSSRGLGLSFCRLAVNAHGGRIWVEDASPGTTVAFVLPRRQADEHPGLAGASGPNLVLAAHG